MRVEPYTEGVIMHVVKRGTRGVNIVRDESDRRHFVQSLLYLNDEYQDRNWREAIKQIPFLSRPAHWPDQKRLVDVLAWTLVPNHLHLILRALKNRAIGKFMQRLCGSMSSRFNAKYEEKGSLFQSAYKGRIVEAEADLRWLASYVMVKNVLELYPGGLTKAAKQFEDAWQWAIKYRYSSMATYATGFRSPIITMENNPISDLFQSPKQFKEDSHDMILAFVQKNANVTSEVRLH